jgi:hypothetical protein
MNIPVFPFVIMCFFALAGFIFLAIGIWDSIILFLVRKAEDEVSKLEQEVHRLSRELDRERRRKINNPNQ